MTNAPLFSAHFARPDEIEQAYKFYNRDQRPPQVYLRKFKVFKQAVLDGRVLLVKDHKDQIVMSSALYILAEGKGIGYEAAVLGGPAKKNAVVAEVGSVFKDPARNDLHGFFLEFAYTAWMLEVFRRAGRGWSPVDVMVTDVQSHRENMLRRLEGGKEGNQDIQSVLRWERFLPAEDLLSRFMATIDKSDPNASKEKFFLRASVSSLLLAAERMINYVQTSQLENNAGEKLSIDLSQLPFLNVCAGLLARRDEFENLVKRAGDNGTGGGEVSLYDTARQMPELQEAIGVTRHLRRVRAALTIRKGEPEPNGDGARDRAEEVRHVPKQAVAG